MNFLLTCFSISLLLLFRLCLTACLFSSFCAPADQSKSCGWATESWWGCWMCVWVCVCVCVYLTAGIVQEDVFRWLTRSSSWLLYWRCLPVWGRSAFQASQSLQRVCVGEKGREREINALRERNSTIKHQRDDQGRRRDCAFGLKERRCYQEWIDLKCQSTHRLLFLSGWKHWWQYSCQRNTHELDIVGLFDILTKA